MKRALATLLLLALTTATAHADSTTNSKVINQEVPRLGNQGFYATISGAPSGAIITQVEAAFSYIAYNGVEEDVSVRFNRGSDPGAGEGNQICPPGSLPDSGAGGATYGWITTHNWDGLSVNANYWFHFYVGATDPQYGATVSTIYVRVTYDVPGTQIIGASTSLTINPTRTSPSLIYVLPDMSEYGFVAPFENEKNWSAAFRMRNNGTGTVAIQDWGIRVTGGVGTGYRLTYGSGMTLSPGQTSAYFDKRGYTTQNQLSGGSTTSYTAQIQYQVAGVWYDAEGSGVSRSYTVYPRPTITDGMIVKRPRNEFSGDSSHAIIYYTQNGYKWRGTETALNALLPGWATSFYVYPISTISGLGTPATPDSDSTTPEVTGRNFLYLSGIDVYIVEPEPGQSSPPRSRLFDDEAAFYSYGYDSVILSQQVFPATSSQVSWLQIEYPVGSTIAVSPSLTLTSPTNGSSVGTAHVDFTWSDVGASWYELLVDDDQNFSSPDVSYDNIQEVFGPTKNIIPNWFTPGLYYWRVVAHMPDGSTQPSADWTFNFDPPTLASPAWEPLYRLYNPPARDHFYCSNAAHAIGAQGEGYNDEGVEGHVSYTPFDDPDMVCLYRLWDFDHGCHYYTTDPADKDDAIQNRNHGYGGITGYLIGVPRQGLVPIYHLLKQYPDGDPDWDNFYTVSEFERQNAVSEYGFFDMGIEGYVSPSGLMGLQPWNYFAMSAGVGVSSDNGNFQHHTSSDFAIPGVGLPLAFGHTYNSLGVFYPRHTRSMGAGWSHTYDAHISESAGYRYINWGDGRMDIYDAVADTSVIKGNYDEILVSSSDDITIKRKDQVRFRFLRMATGYPLLLSEISDRNGNAITLHYETLGLRRLDEIEGPMGRVLRLHYGATQATESLIHRVEDLTGNRNIYFTYDEHNNLETYTDPEGSATTYSYDQVATNEHQLLQIQTQGGTIIDNTYDERRLKSQLWDGSTGGMTMVYSGNTRQITYQDGSPGVTIDYDDPPSPNIPRSPTSITAGSSTVEFTFDYWTHSTLPSSTLDPKGNQTSFQYDSRGNVTRSDHPLGVLNRYTYDGFNNPTSHIDPNNETTTYSYDGNGNLQSVTRPEGHVTSVSRNSNGQPSSVTTFFGTTQFTYDPYGYLKTIVNPLSHTTTLDHDPVGRLGSVTNAKSQTTTYQHNNRDQLTQIAHPTAPSSGNVMIGYDVDGLRSSVSGPGPSATTWSYDNGFLTGYQPPGSSTTYSYYDDGSVASRTRPAGGRVDYTYDSSGRLQGMTGATTGSFTYDANANVLTATQDGRQLRFTYDALNRVGTAVDFWGNNVSYGYDDASNVTSITYEPGVSVGYTYDGDNRMTSVTDFDGGVTSYGYHLDGSVSRIDYPNGIWTTYGYDGAGRLTSQVTRNSSYVLASYDFTLDPIGNIMREVASEPFPAPELPNESFSYTVNANNQITSAEGSSYSYDGNGNVTALSGARNLSFTYDGENRLTTVTGEFIATYIYDVFGNRRSATRGGVETRYVLDPIHRANILYETDSSGQVIHRYVHGLGLISRHTSSGSPRYYHFDSGGNTVALTGSNGINTHMYSMSPFGEVLDAHEANPNPFKFVGAFGVMEETEGLYFMRARYYLADTGRFLGQDPVFGTNLYQYGRNNPLIWMDPEGTFELRWSDVIGRVKDAKNVVGAAIKAKVQGFNTQASVSGTAAMANVLNVLGSAYYAMGEQAFSRIDQCKGLREQVLGYEGEVLVGLGIEENAGYIRNHNTCALFGDYMLPGDPFLDKIRAALREGALK